MNDQITVSYGDKFKGNEVTDCIDLYLIIINKHLLKYF